MKKVDLIQVFERLGAAYGDRFENPTDITIDTWFETFEKIDSHYIIEGTKKYIRENRFPPTPHDIISCARKVFEDDVKAEQAKAQLMSEGFASMCAYYPGAYQCNRDECMYLFKRIVYAQHKPPNEVANQITDFVRKMELSGSVNSLKPLNEFLKEKLNE